MSDPAEVSLRLDEIQMGDRCRKDMGDLQGLANTIKEDGLLHPIVVTPAGLLVCGQRRIEAVRLLGWSEIPARIIDVPDLLKAERAENEIRKNFTPTEAVAIGLLIEKQERPKAEERQRVGAVKSAAVRRGDVDSTEPSIKEDPVRDKAAKAVGMGSQKYTQAKAVVAAAEADPQKFGDLPEQMDTTGNVSGTHREMERRKTANGRHPIFKGTHYPNPAREIERAIVMLEGVVLCFSKTDFTKLDAAKRKDWAEALKKAVGGLRATVARIEGKKR